MPIPWGTLFIGGMSIYSMIDGSIKYAESQRQRQQDLQQQQRMRDDDLRRIEIQKIQDALLRKEMEDKEYNERQRITRHDQIMGSNRQLIAQNDQNRTQFASDAGTQNALTGNIPAGRAGAASVSNK
jgi:hypothetical protein